MMKRIGELNKEVTNLKAEVDRFKAEVERLTKAGDAMQTRLNFFQKRWDNDELCEEAEAWLAAKEGKQP
jgi:predicted RNase H-like nuclease (RuvC/YqgF family)